MYQYEVENYDNLRRTEAIWNWIATQNNERAFTVCWSSKIYKGQSEMK